jgi:hypothetical protein
VKKDNIDINMNTPLEPETLPEYLEGWRRKIWDQGFGPALKGGSHFKKSDSFASFDGSMLAVKRVLYRYTYLLIPSSTFMHSLFVVYNTFDFERLIMRCCFILKVL